MQASSAWTVLDVNQPSEILSNNLKRFESSTDVSSVQCTVLFSRSDSFSASHSVLFQPLLFLDMSTVPSRRLHVWILFLPWFLPTTCPSKTVDKRPLCFRQYPLPNPTSSSLSYYPLKQISFSYTLSRTSLLKTTLATQLIMSLQWLCRWQAPTTHANLMLLTHTYWIPTGLHKQMKTLQTERITTFKNGN